MIKRFAICVLALGVGTMVGSAAAVAGEIKGPPPAGNYTGTEIDMHAHSACAFSGLNDSPLGDPDAGDPGGQTQSFGSFFGSNPDFDVSGLDPREDFLSPGFGCNPNRGSGGG